MNRSLRILSAAFLICLAFAGTAQAGFAPTNEPVIEAKNLHPTGLATDAQGNALVTWSQEPTEDLHLVRARRVSATGDIGPIIEVAPGETGFRPDVAMTPSGRAFVAWRVLTETNTDSVKGRWLEPDGSLGPILTLATGQAGVENAGNTQVVISPAGVVTVAWQNFAPNTLELRRVNPDSTTGPLLEDVAEGSVTNPVATALPSDSTLIVWRGSGTEKNVVTAAGAIGMAQKISETSTAGDNKVAVDAAGNSLVVWRQSTGDEYAVRGRRLDPAGAPVGPELTIEPLSKGFLGGDPFVSADTVGNFLVTWGRQDDGSNATLYARGINSAAAFAGPEQVVSVPGINARDHRSTLLDGGVGALLWRDAIPGDPVVGRAVNGLGAPTSGIQPIFSDGFGGELVSSAPATGFAAFTVGYALSGSEQGVALRRFMVPPTCAGSSAAVVQGRPVSVPISCTGPAIEGAQVIEQPRHGTLDQIGPPTDSFTYTPRPGYEGTDSFTYAGLNDGGASAATQVTLSVSKDTVKPRIKKLKFIRKGKKFRVVVTEPAKAVVRVKSVRRSDGKRRIKLIGRVATKKVGTKLTIKVRGRLAKKLAAGGRFRAIAVATDPARNKSKSKRISFKLNG